MPSSSSSVANPRMVTLVREAKGWSQGTLAAESGLSQGYLSKIEAGLLDLEGARLVAVSTALDCLPDLLTENQQVRGVEITCLHHRRRASKVSSASRKKIEAVAHLSRVSVEAVLAPVDVEVKHPLVRLGMNGDSTPSEKARELRRMWELGPGPVPNVVKLLERAGIVLHVRAFGTAAQDAVSSWPADRLPMMLVNSNLPSDRQRFTLSHELGHLVMHVLPSDTQEAEANEFAGEFLAPAEDIAGDLAGLTTAQFPRLLELKGRWGMSVAALIQRAKDIDVITDRQFREFQVRLNALGWKTVEPVTLPHETPSLLDHAIELQVSQSGVDLAGLAASARMTEEAFRRHFYPHAPSADADRLTVRIPSI